MLLRKVTSAEGAPSGRSGYYFAEAGALTWREVAQGIADVLYSRGQLDSAIVSAWPDIKTAARELPSAFSTCSNVAELTSGGGAGDMGISEEDAWSAWSSGILMRGDRPRQLGWSPSYDRAWLLNNFAVEIDQVIEEEGPIIL